MLIKEGQAGKTVHVVLESRGKREDRDLELEFRRICNNERRQRERNPDFRQLEFRPIFQAKSVNSTGLQAAWPAALASRARLGYAHRAPLLCVRSTAARLRGEFGMSALRVMITGAWSYSGRYVARRLLDRGDTVVSLTNHPAPDLDLFQGQVRAVPFDFTPGRLAAHLADVDVLACAYWTRHNQPPVGHRGPWLSHAAAAHRSAALIREAKTAGVRRLVWTSIANPGLDADLSYYQGKAQVEEAVKRSGLPYGILRPACFFGPGSILLENVAWAVRHLPVFPLPAAAAPFHVRPIHVEDYAVLVAAAVHAPESFVRDAAGPDRMEFAALVRHLGAVLGRRTRPVALPLPVCHLLYAAASRALGETILTRDELQGLARNRLDSLEAPAGTTSLRAYIAAHAQTLGRRFLREPRRRPALP